jgi:NitT/TauT family transport system ATP-binding protein
MGAPTGDVLLSVKELSLRLGGAHVLRNLSFDVHDRVRPGTITGQIVGILGPSGVGKTRLLRLIAGLDSQDSGSITGIKGKLLRAGEVGVVFQNYPLLRHRTVRGNLEIAGIANGVERHKVGLRVKELLEAFQLSDRATFYPAQLSGGQRQRVAIAQQLVQPKTLLLMDEPFSGLDPAALEDVIRVIVQVANLDELNTILIVTHDIRAAIIASDTLLMLGRDRTADGKIVPGARIQSTFDLVEQGLAWQQDVEHMPQFAPLEKEIKSRFKQL